MPDTRPRVTAAKAYDLAALSAEVGAGLTDNESTGEIVVADPESDVTVEQLQAALDDHVPPDPMPTSDERLAALEARLDDVAALAEQANVTAQEIAQAARPAR